MAANERIIQQHPTPSVLQDNKVMMPQGWRVLKLLLRLFCKICGTHFRDLTYSEVSFHIQNNISATFPISYAIFVLNCSAKQNLQPRLLTSFEAPDQSFKFFLFLIRFLLQVGFFVLWLSSLSCKWEWRKYWNIATIKHMEEFCLEDQNRLKFFITISLSNTIGCHYKPS